MLLDRYTSASARTRRCVVIHFDFRYLEDVVLVWWSGRPARIAVAARSMVVEQMRNVKSRGGIPSLPPVVPEPRARHTRHILRESRLLHAVQIEVRAIRQPIQAIFVEFRGQIRRGGEINSRLVSGGSGLLVRIVNAFILAACDNLDIGFLTGALVEEWARDCPGDGADLHRRAHAPVEDVLLCGGDLGAEDGHGGLPSWYRELQSTVFDSYVPNGVVLGVWGSADVVSAYS